MWLLTNLNMPYLTQFTLSKMGISIRFIWNFLFEKYSIIVKKLSFHFKLMYTNLQPHFFVIAYVTYNTQSS